MIAMRRLNRIFGGRFAHPLPAGFRRGLSTRRFVGHRRRRDHDLRRMQRRTDV